MKYCLGIVLLLALTSGCAVLNDDNRHVTELLDKQLTPTSTAGKIAAAPAAIPVGLAALAIDGGVINPVIQIPEAIDDACGVFEIDSCGICEVVVFPMRLVTFGVILVSSETVRCLSPF